MVLLGRFLDSFPTSCLYPFQSFLLEPVFPKRCILEVSLDGTLFAVMSHDTLQPAINSGGELGPETLAEHMRSRQSHPIHYLIPPLFTTI